MEIITLAAGAVGLAILVLMALAPLLADLPLPRQALGRLAAPAPEPAGGDARSPVHAA